VKTKLTKKLLNIFLYSLPFFLLLISGSAEAAYRYWVGPVGGNFSDSANWANSSGGAGGAAVPGIWDIANFDGGGNTNVTLDSTVNVGGFYIRSSYTQTITQASGVTVTVGAENGVGFNQEAGTFVGGNSAISFTGDFSLSGGSFTAPSILNVGHHWIHTGGTFAHNNGTVNLIGSSCNMTLPDNSQSFYNLEVNLVDNTNLGLYGVAQVAITHLLTLTDGNIQSGTYNTPKFSHAATFDGGTGSNGKIVVDSGSETNTINSAGAMPKFTLNAPNSIINISGSSTVAFQGNVELTAGTFNWSSNNYTFSNSLTVNGATTTGGSGNIAITSDFNVSSGSFTSGTGSISAQNMYFTGGTVSFANASAISSVGDFQIDGATFTASANTMTVGRWNHTSGTFAHNSGTIDVTTDGNTISVPDANQVFYNLTSTNSHFLGNSITVNNNFAFTHSINNNTITAKGNVTMASTATGGTTRFTFAGANAQTIALNAGGSWPSGNVIINKTNASDPVTVTGDAWSLNNAGQDLTITKGILNIAGNNLTVNDQFVNDSEGTIQVQGTEAVTALSSNLGTVEYLGASGSHTYNSLVLGNSYYNLIINGPSDIFKHTGTLDVDNNLTIANGTLDSNGQNITLAGNLSNAGSYISGANTVILDGTGAQSIVTGGTGTTQDFNNLTINKASGTATLTTNNIDIDGNFTLTSGTFDANSLAMTVSGNWDNSGTFTANSGSVTLAGSNQTLSGSTTFHNLSKSVSAADTLTFTASSTQTVTGTLTLNGASGQLLSLRSSSNGSQWNLDPQGSRVFSYLDVKDSNNIHATKAVALTSSTSGNNTNWNLSAPSLTNPGAQSVAEIAILSFSLSATDGDGDTISYSCSANCPAGLTVNAGTGAVSWTPTYAQAGTFSTVTFRATDGSNSSTQAITITVTNTDTTPALADPGAQSVAEAATLSFSLSATDADGDTVSYSCSANCPSGLTVNAATGAVLWTPTYAQAGTYNAVTFSASDTSTHSATRAITITVTNVDTNPSLADPGNKTLAEGATLSFSLSASDADGDTLSYSCSANCPSGLSVNAATGAVLWAPNYTQSGTYSNVTFRVADPQNNASTRLITISVTNTDSTPSLTDPGTQAIKKGASLSLTLSGSDADGDPVTYSCSANCPSGLSVNSATGVVSWTPATNQSGVYSSVTFQAADPQNNLGTQAITINVTGVTVTEAGGSTNATEGGSGDNYTVVLTSPPTANVAVTVTADAQVSVSPSTLTFTTANWSTPQTVTVSAVNESRAEGNHSGAISHASTSADATYNTLSIDSIAVNLTDNDSAGVSVTESGGSSAVTEAGATDSLSVVLTTEPNADVTVSLTANSQLTLSSSSLVFTAANWATPQNITVSAVDDLRAEGSHNGTISMSVSSSDSYYQALSLSSLTVAITDNDSAGVSLTQSSSSTSVSEAGTTDSYSIVLTSEPTSNVVVTVNPGAGVTVDASSLTFTAANWNQAQTVTVSAVNDSVVEGIHTATITHSAASADSNYNALSINSLSVSITDDDSEDEGDNGGGSSVTLTVNAGADQTLRATTSTLLSPSVNASERISDTYTYAWSIDSSSTADGSLSDRSVPNPTFTAGTSSGKVVLNLTVTHSSGVSGSDSVVIHLFSSSAVKREELAEHVIGGQDGRAITQTTTVIDNVERMVMSGGTQGAAQIIFPQSANTRYSFAFTKEDHIVFGLPGEENGKGIAALSNVPFSDLSGSINLEELYTTVRNGTQSRSLSSGSDPWMMRSLSHGSDPWSRSLTSHSSSLFSYETGAQDDAAFGTHVAAGDLNGDGVDEIVVGAPNDGDYGKVYIYNQDYSVRAVIEGSELYPVSSVIVANYVNATGSKADLILGPNNMALNANLMNSDALITRDLISSVVVLSEDKAPLEGTILLAERGADASFGSGLGSIYQSVALGDMNGDGELDLVIMTNSGEGYIYLGTQTVDTHLSAAEADITMSGGEASTSLGRMMAIADVTGDGIGDLVIGAPEYGAGTTGGLYVIFGSTSFVSGSTIDLSSNSSQALLISGAEAGDAIGSDLLLIVNTDNTNDASDIYTLKSNNKVVRLNLARALASAATPGSPAISGGGCSMSAVNGSHSAYLPMLALLALMSVWRVGRKIVV
jgi:hypothetical protein